MVKKMIKLVRDENGQAFPMALIVLAMGSLFVGGFLTSVDTTLLTSEVYSRPVPYIYTADAGVEDALWGLRYGTLADTLQDQGGQYTYTMTEPVNGNYAEITVSGSDGTVAADDFEGHKWKGGTGWLGDWLWDDNKNADVTKKLDPYQPDYHAQIDGPAVNLRRNINLAGYTDVRLQFWAKPSLFEENDTVYCQVSSNGTDWTTVYTWDSDDSNNIYSFYDIDLSAFEMSSDFWIGFESTMVEDAHKDEDYFHIDLITVTSGSAGYRIVSVSGEKTTTATLEMDEGTPSVLTWVTE